MRTHSDVEVNQEDPREYVDDDLEDEDLPSRELQRQ